MEKNSSKPTQIGQSKVYSLTGDSNISYKIKLTFGSDKLIIDIEENESFPKIYYSSTFLLNEIQKNDKWFRLFDSFEESFDTIDGLFEEKKVNIIQKEKNINLILIHLEKNISNSVFPIEKKEISEKDIIPSLIESNNDLRKKIKILEQNNGEMKEKIDKLMSIPFISKYILKSSNNILEGIINKEEEKNLIFSWINPNIEKISTKLIYSARIDGDNSSTFHELCDYIGPNLIIVKTVEGTIFGGYTTENWRGDGQYKTDEKAFIFSLDNKIKAKLIEKDHSIYCCYDRGPTFGAGHDLYICSGCLTSNGSYMKPYSYQYEGSNSNNHPFLSKRCFPNTNNCNNFQCKNVEVYAIFEN